MKTISNFKKVLLATCGLLFIACCLIFSKKIILHVEPQALIFKSAAADTPSFNMHPIDHYIRKKLRVVLIEMVIDKSLLIEDIRFNSPDHFNMLRDHTQGFFHPEGGKAPYELADPQWLEEGYDGRWIFSGELALRNQESYNYKKKNPKEYKALTEIIVFLPGIKRTVCAQINESWGIKGIPRLKSDQSALYLREIIDENETDYHFPEGDVTYLDNEILDNQPSGCFENYKAGTYVYYGLLMER